MSVTGALRAPSVPKVWRRSYVGHAQIQPTMRYVHFRPRNEAARELSEAVRVIGDPWGRSAPSGGPVTGRGPQFAATGGGGGATTGGGVTAPDGLSSQAMPS
jgi:hypothetical protein